MIAIYNTDFVSYPFIQIRFSSSLKIKCNFRVKLSYWLSYFAETGEINYALDGIRQNCKNLPVQFLAPVCEMNLIINH